MASFTAKPFGTLIRWSYELQQYDFSIEYRTDSLNIVADALSRAPVSGNRQKVDWYERMIELVQNNNK